MFVQQLTPQEKRNWIKRRYSHCPYCDCEDLDTTDEDIDGNIITLYVICCNCTREWNEHYKLYEITEVVADGDESSG